MFADSRKLPLYLGVAAALAGTSSPTVLAHAASPVIEVAAVAPQAAEEPAPVQAPRDESAVVARGVTILLVDDDALISDSTAYLLEDLGHEVIEADSGANALEVLRSGKKVDLLITDYSMPKMTGMQLAHAARELRPDLPIVIATGYADLPLGTTMDIVRLRKPYQQHQLAAEIAKALRIVR